jgi:hypothetical protein
VRLGRQLRRRRLLPRHSGNTQGVLLTESSGTWAQGVEAVLPAGAAANPNVSLDSVSCPSAGDCAAIGEYADSSGQQDLLLTQMDRR